MKKKIIPFTATATPTIPNYQTTYAATYGEYPDVKCIIMNDANNGYQRQQMPQMTFVDGKLDSIYFDLGEKLSGYIILS